MNKIIIATVALFSISVSCRAQEHKRYGDTTIHAGDRIFNKVEVEAHFEGGDKAWIRYLQENLRADVPVKKRAPAGVYTVVVKFIVNTDGQVDSVRAETDHGYGMEKEVIRIIKKAPRWIPARADGKPVRAYRRQPVTFLIEKA